MERPSEELINSSSRSGQLSENEVFEFIRKVSYLAEVGGRMNDAVDVALMT